MSSKKICLATALILALLVIMSNSVFALAKSDDPQIPSPTNEFYCNDFADILGTDTENRIIDMGELTSTKTKGGQIVFVSIKSLEGYSIEEYANALYNKWGIGNKADEGILFILSMDEGESRIEVGYGYEGILTDIQSNKLLTEFAELNSDYGIENAVYQIYSKLCAIAAGEVQPPSDYNNNNYSDSDSKGERVIQYIIKHPLVLIIVVILILLDIIFTRGRITMLIFRMMMSGRGGGRGGNSGGGGRSGGGGSSSRF